MILKYLTTQIFVDESSVAQNGWFHTGRLTWVMYFLDQRKHLDQMLCWRNGDEKGC